MTALRIVPRKGDPDPTAMDRLCMAINGRRFCTWPAGHSSPWHVAGDGVIVRATWLVAP